MNKIGPPAVMQTARSMLNPSATRTHRVGRAPRQRVCTIAGILFIRRADYIPPRTRHNCAIR